MFNSATRELKNKTGIEVSVTSYDPAPTPKQVKHYHVVVITNLPFFKLSEHSERDVVHFMVSQLTSRQVRSLGVTARGRLSVGL